MRPNCGIKNRLLRKSGMISLCFFILFIDILAISVAHSNAQDTKRGEYEVKAAFIYNFLKFIEWPDKVFTDNPFTMNLCIVGENPFGNAINSYQGDKVSNRTIAIKKSESLQDIRNCHVVFISRSEKDRIQQIMKALRGSNILSIGDTDTFEKQGVIINFSIVENKVRFNINVNAARQSGLRISSKLLKLSRAVYD